MLCVGKMPQQKCFSLIAAEATQATQATNATQATQATQGDGSDGNSTRLHFTNEGSNKSGRKPAVKFSVIYATLNCDISAQRPLIEKFKKRDCHYFARIRLFSQ